jgi:hypothetical protein
MRKKRNSDLAKHSSYSRLAAKARYAGKYRQADIYERKAAEHLRRYHETKKFAENLRKRDEADRARRAQAKEEAR